MEKVSKLKNKKLIAFLSFFMLSISVSAVIGFIIGSLYKKSSESIKITDYSSIKEMQWKNESTFLDTKLQMGSSEKMFETIKRDFNRYAIFGPEIASLRNIIFTDVTNDSNEEAITRGVYISDINIIKIFVNNIFKVTMNSYGSILWDKMKESEKMFAIENSIFKTLKHEYIHHLANAYLRQPTETGRILGNDLKDIKKIEQLERNYYYNNDKVNNFFDISINKQECNGSFTHKNYKDTVLDATNKSLKFFYNDEEFDTKDTDLSKKLSIAVIDSIEKNKNDYSSLPYRLPIPPRLWPRPSLISEGEMSEMNYLLSFEEQFARTYNWLLIPPSLSKLNSSLSHGIRIESRTLLFRSSLCANWRTIKERNILYSSLLNIMNYGSEISNIWYEKTASKNFKLEGYINNKFLLDDNGKIRDNNEIHFKNKKTGKIITKKIIIPWTVNENKTGYNKNIYNWNTENFLFNHTKFGLQELNDNQLFKRKSEGDSRISNDQNIAYYTEMLNASNFSGEYIVDINGHKISSENSVYSNFDFDGAGTREAMKEDNSITRSTDDATFKDISKNISILNKETNVSTFNIPYLKENFPYWDKEKSSLIIK